MYILHDTSAFSQIQLTEDVLLVPKQHQVLRVGKFKHPQYGEFEITTQTLAEMKANFDNKVRGIDMAWDYFHDSDKDAAAWVNALELREDGRELWATVSWTPTAEKKLMERELRYFSPDFAFQWQDPESGQVHSNVLFGGGLTNRPFVKEMKAIVAHENNKGEPMTELEKVQKALTDEQAKVVKLSEEKSGLEQQLAAMPAPSKVEELEAQIAKLQADLAAAKQESENALAEKKKADEAKMLAEKENEFNVMLSEGRVCAAQKDAFIKDDMKTFIKLSQPVNLNGKGSGAGADETESDKTKSIIKLAEEKQKANPKLNRAEAISMAKKEIEKSK